METTKQNTTAQSIKNPKLVVAVAAFAAFLATFNETFMNVAFAPIMSDLQPGICWQRR